MTLLAIGIILPVIAWALLLARVTSEPRGFLTHLPTAVGLGLGTSSAVWWALMLLPIGSHAWMMGIDALFWILSVIVIWIWRLPTPAGTPAAARTDGPAARWTSMALMIGAAVGAVVVFTAVSVVMPHGNWDAWAIWNARARFLFLGYPEVWTEAFSPLLAWSHPDYPLMVPLSVARAWTYIGQESVVVPVFVAAAFTVGIVATAAASVGRVTSTARGVITAVMILASPAFMRSAPSQFADIPLAFFILTTFVMIGRATASDDWQGGWAVAGIAVGLAAWTKNEGTVFAAVVFGLCAAWAYRRERWKGLERIAPLFRAAVPILIVLVVFRMFFAPSNDLASAQSVDHMRSSLGDVHRLQIVLAAIGRELWYGGATWVGTLPILGLFLLAVGVRRPVDAGPLLGIAAVGALLAMDFMAYVLTPHPLAWHLRTSLDRVVVQVVPTLIWCGMSLAGDPRDATAPEVRRSDPLQAFHVKGMEGGRGHEAAVGDHVRRVPRHNTTSYGRRLTGAAGAPSTMPPTAR